MHLWTFSHCISASDAEELATAVLLLPGLATLPHCAHAEGECVSADTYSNTTRTLTSSFCTSVCTLQFFMQCKKLLWNGDWE